MVNCFSIDTIHKYTITIDISILLVIILVVVIIYFSKIKYKIWIFILLLFIQFWYLINNPILSWQSNVETSSGCGWEYYLKENNIKIFTFVLDWIWNRITLEEFNQLKKDFNQ